MRYLMIGLLSLAVSPALAGADGQLHDPGLSMTRRAAGAPEALDRVAGLVGSWDLREVAADGTARTGGAEISWMNRGHGLLVRTYLAPAGDEPAVHGLALLVVDKAGIWTWGEATSETLAVRVMSNPSTPEVGLVLHGVARPGGSSAVELSRRTLTTDGADFQLADEVSTDFGSTWQGAGEMAFTRRTSPLAELVPGAGIGRAAEERLPAAAAFDFLLGDHTATHWLLAGGREVRFQSRTTAVYALGGHAILEFDSYDVDPSLPDAATTVLRVYNPAQERWESLYVTNRFNQLLWFGGTQRGDEIVLTRFEVDATSAPGRFVFHDIRGPGQYRWYADSSADGGRTFNKTWTIDVAPSR